MIDVMHCYAVGAYYYLQPAPNCLPRQVADRSGAGDADAGLSVNVSTKFFNYKMRYSETKQTPMSIILKLTAGGDK